MASVPHRLHHVDSTLFRQFPDGFEIVLGRNGTDTVYSLAPGIPSAFRKRDLIPRTPIKTFSTNISADSNEKENIIHLDSDKRQSIKCVSTPDTHPFCSESIPVIHERILSQSGTDLDTIDTKSSPLKVSYSHESNLSSSLQADCRTSPHQTRHVSSSSRIPISKVSPIPIPVELVNRTVPMHLSEKNNSLDHNTLSLVRRRLSEPDFHIRRKIPAPDTVLTKVRKCSAPITTSTRHRSKSIPSLLSTRPNAPSGPPPWVISQPLVQSCIPPHQQIIPTVARRLEAERIAQVLDGDPTSIRLWDRNINPTLVERCPPKRRQHFIPSNETQNQSFDKFDSTQVSETNSSESPPTSPKSTLPRRTVEGRMNVADSKRRIYKDTLFNEKASSVCCVIL